MLVRIGEPYPTALAATKALTPNPDVLKPLDRFAEKGVPNAGRLSSELLALVPKVSPAAQPSTATTGTGIVERLQAGAAKLVKIERTDTAGTDRGAVVARITAAALRNDVNEARQELKTLEPDDRAAAPSSLERPMRATPRRRLPKIRRRSHGGARQTGAIRFRWSESFFSVVDRRGAAGAAWIAEQTGDVVLSWGGWRVQTTLPVFVLVLGIGVVAAMLCGRCSRGCCAAAADAAWRRAAAGARPRCDRARADCDRPGDQKGRAAMPGGAEHASQNPLTLMLAAQSAQMSATARRASRVPRHGRARGHAAAGPARPVHRGATQRRSAAGGGGAEEA